MKGPFKGFYESITGAGHRSRGSDRGRLGRLGVHALNACVSHWP